MQLASLSQHFCICARTFSLDVCSTELNALFSQLRPSSAYTTPYWTTNSGAPVWNNNSSVTVGARGEPLSLPQLLATLAVKVRQLQWRVYRADPEGCMPFGGGPSQLCSPAQPCLVYRAPVCFRAKHVALSLCEAGRLDGSARGWSCACRPRAFGRLPAGGEACAGERLGSVCLGLSSCPALTFRVSSRLPDTCSLTARGSQSVLSMLVEQVPRASLRWAQSPISVQC